MNKAGFDRTWNYFRAVNGVGLRALDMSRAERLDARKITGFSSP